MALLDFLDPVKRQLNQRDQLSRRLKALDDELKWRHRPLSEWFKAWDKLNRDIDRWSVKMLDALEKKNFYHDGNKLPNDFMDLYPPRLVYERLMGCLEHAGTHPNEEKLEKIKGLMGRLTLSPGVSWSSSYMLNTQEMGQLMDLAFSHEALRSFGNTCHIWNQCNDHHLLGTLEDPEARMWWIEYRLTHRFWHKHEDAFLRTLKEVQRVVSVHPISASTLWTWMEHTSLEKRGVKPKIRGQELLKMFEYWATHHEAKGLSLHEKAWNLFLDVTYSWNTKHQKAWFERHELIRQKEMMGMDVVMGAGPRSNPCPGWKEEVWEALSWLYKKGAEGLENGETWATFLIKNSYRFKHISSEDVHDILTLATSCGCDLFKLNRDGFSALDLVNEHTDERVVQWVEYHRLNRIKQTHQNEVLENPECVEVPSYPSLTRKKRL